MAVQKINIVQALNQALKQEMARDRNVILLGEDIGRHGGVFRLTDGLQKGVSEDRGRDTPLAELGIISAAIGMAVVGIKPVVEIEFGGFMYSGLAHLIDHAARIRNRSRG